RRYRNPGRKPTAGRIWPAVIQGGPHRLKDLRFTIYDFRYSIADVSKRTGFKGPKSRIVNQKCSNASWSPTVAKLLYASFALAVIWASKWWRFLARRIATPPTLPWRTRPSALARRLPPKVT